MKKNLLRNVVGLGILSAGIVPLFSYSSFDKKPANAQAYAYSATQKKPGPDLETIRKRIINDLLQPAINEGKVQELVATIKADGSWPGIDYKDTTRTGFQHKDHLENMFELARAYKKPGSKFYKNAEVKKTVSSALDFWLDHDFICQNWWWNEMGTPTWMINTLLVLDEDLTERQRTEGYRIAHRANLEAFGARPGGDLIVIAGLLGKQGLFQRDEATLQRVINTMASEIKISEGRGLQPDLSFHHRTDNVISTLTYGSNFASAFSYWAVKIAGTKFTLPEDAMKLLIDYYLDGISKSMAFGKYPDIGAMNRDMSRKDILEKESSAVPENLMKASNYRKAELEALVKIRKQQMQPNLSWDRFFWHSEYFTHQRPKWFSSVRMHSSRQNTMEEPHNEEGLKMHYFADGSNFISLTGKEYFNIFPVWDWQKIPGATILQKPEIPHWKEIAKKGASEFVGGVSDGLYGASAFDFKSVHNPLRAKKAWFFFDNEYVCLGTGITSEAAYPVYTTLNQCLMGKDVLVKTNKTSNTLKKGKHELKNVSWVLHDGVAYLFPSPVNVSLTNETVTGSWRQINHQAWATDEPVKKEVFSLWIDHGTKPKDASYSYIILPRVSGAMADKYAQKPEVKILANTPQIQAVQHQKLNRTEIVFYEPATLKISNKLSLTAASPCMVMIKTEGGHIQQLVVSDPSRKLTAVQLLVNTPINQKGKEWQAQWNQDKKESVINIALPKEGYAGESVIVTLAK